VMVIGMLIIGQGQTTVGVLFIVLGLFFMVSYGVIQTFRRLAQKRIRKQEALRLFDGCDPTDENSLPVLMAIYLLWDVDEDGRLSGPELRDLFDSLYRNLQKRRFNELWRKMNIKISDEFTKDDFVSLIETWHPTFNEDIRNRPPGPTERRNTVSNMVSGLRKNSIITSGVIAVPKVAQSRNSEHGAVIGPSSIEIKKVSSTASAESSTGGAAGIALQFKDEEAEHGASSPHIRRPEIV